MSGDDITLKGTIIRTCLQINQIYVIPLQEHITRKAYFGWDLTFKMHFSQQKVMITHLLSSQDPSKV